MPIPHNLHNVLLSAAREVNGEPPTKRDWAMMEIAYELAIKSQDGMGKRTARGLNEQTRVSLLAARRMKRSSGYAQYNKAQVLRDMAEAGIRYVSSDKYISDRTLNRYLYEPTAPGKIPEHYIDLERKSPMKLPWLEIEIATWEEINGIPLNQGLPKGW